MILARLTVRNMFGLCRYLLLRARFRNLQVGPFFLDRGAEFRVEPRARPSFGRGIQFMRDCTVHLGGRVTIGNDVFFNRGCHVIVIDALSIGDNCLFGEMVSIHDESHVPGRVGGLNASRELIGAPIVIGNNVWVGAKATILQGVTIGDNAVVGANSVVTRDIPPNSLAVGAPARVVRTTTT